MPTPSLDYCCGLTFFYLFTFTIHYQFTLHDSMSDQQDVPQILTGSALARLSADLDAGDDLECYLLSRSTPLHGLLNSTGTSSY